MVDWNPAIWLISCRGLKFDRPRCREIHVLKTIDSGLNRDLLSFRHLEIFDIFKKILKYSDTKGFGTTSDTKGGGGGRPTPLLSHNSLDL